MPERVEPQYHGDDLAAAYTRAKNLPGGMVIYSAAPGGHPRDGEFGYWSDADALVRGWEREVYTRSSDASLAAVQVAEARHFRRFARY